MPYLNEVTIMGHVGRVDELRHTNNGTAVLNFTLATSDKRGGEERTEWHNITCWKRWAEIAEKDLTVGALVYVSGRIETQEWEKDGETKRKTVIQAGRVFKLRDAHSKGAPKDNATSGDDEDLPF